MSGTRVREPAPGDGVVEVDTEDVTQGGELRKRQRIMLSGNGDEAPTAFVTTTEPGATDAGVVVRHAGLQRAHILYDAAGNVISRLPVEAHLTDEAGVPFSTANRLPVELGTTTIQASFDSIVSTGNTTTVPLMANEVFIGDWEVVTDYASISLAITTDAGTPMDGARAQFSIDGVNVVAEQVTTFGDAGGQAFFTLAPEATFFRIHYTNGARAQTVLLAEITYHFNAVGVTQGPLGGPSDDRSMAQVGKAMLHGRHSSGFWAALRSTIDGILSVAVENIVKVQKVNGRIEGTLADDAAATASQVVWPATPATSVVLEVPDGHSSSAVQLSAFSPGTQVVFEQSDTGLDGTWAATNMRRNTTPDVNESFSQIENNPVGTNNVQLWKGTVGGIKYFRVRCAVLDPADAAGVQVILETSEGVGGTYLLGNPPSVSDYFIQGVLDGPGDVVTVRAGGMGGWAGYLTGQFTGTIHFEGSIDGVNFTALTGVVQGVGTLQTKQVGTGNPSQTLQVRGSAGALRTIRLRAGTDFAGLVTGELRAGAGTSGVFMVNPVPIAGIGTAQTRRFAVGTSAQQIDPAALSTRSSVEILYQATGAANNGRVYVGFTNAVLAGNGRELQPGESWTLDLLAAVPIYAIATSADQQVQVTEIG